MTTRELFPSRSPYESMDDRRRQRLLKGVSNVALIVIAPNIILYGLITILQFSWGPLITALLLLAVPPILYLARWLANRGKTSLASYVLLISLCVVIQANVLNIEGLMEIMVPAFLSIIVIAGMLLGPTGGYAFAAVTVIMWLLTRFVIGQDIIPQQVIPAPFDVITVTVITVSAFFFIAAMGQLTIRDLRNALDDATYDLVQSNIKLEDASQLKSKFLARTSHELRTPLNSIIGFTDLSLREVYGPMTELQADGFRRVLSNAKRLLALINDILDLSKIEAGELMLIEDKFPVRNLVDTVETVLRPAANKKNLRFTVAVAEDMPHYIIGDENRLSQIMMNLVDNAIKFTDEGGVTVNMSLGGNGEWYMKVQDTGCGIMEEDFDRIFDDFQQVDDSSGTAQVTGTGLGLSITQHLTRMMGGEITVESKISQGSTFTISLPLRVPQPPSTPVTASA